MNGLLLKDFYNASGQFKIYAIYPILGAFLSYTQESLMMLVMFSAMMIISIPISSFSYDDMAGFTPLALTLPVTRKQIVLAKFVLSFIVTITVIICYLVIVFIMLQVFGDAYFDTNFQEQLFGGLVTCFSINAINCVMIPILFRFGAEKGRMFLFIIPFAVVGIVYCLPPVFAMLPSSTLSTLYDFLNTYGIYIAAVLAFMIELLGIVMSNRIMQKKEF